MLGRYARWLHTGWPAGTVEKLPEVDEDGTTARARRARRRRPDGHAAAQALGRHGRARGAGDPARDGLRRRKGAAGVVDVAIIGGGVSGIAAAIEAQEARALATSSSRRRRRSPPSLNFPKAEADLHLPDGDEAGRADAASPPTSRRRCSTSWRRQRARAGIEIAPRHVERIERRGGELLVHRRRRASRCARCASSSPSGAAATTARSACPARRSTRSTTASTTPHDYAGKQRARRRRRRLGAGDGDRARAAPAPRSRSAIAAPTSRAPSRRTSSALRALEARRVRVLLGSHASRRCAPPTSSLAGADGTRETLPNDVVFAMIGREAPLDFFRRSGIPIRGEWRARDLGRLRRLLRRSAASSTPGRPTPRSTTSSARTSCSRSTSGPSAREPLGKALSDAIASARLLLFVRLHASPSCSSAASASGDGRRPTSRARRCR